MGKGHAGLHTRTDNEAIDERWPFDAPQREWNRMAVPEGMMSTFTGVAPVDQGVNLQVDDEGPNVNVEVDKLDLSAAQPVVPVEAEVKPLTDVADVLRGEGYGVVEGADEVKALIDGMEGRDAVEGEDIEG